MLHPQLEIFIQVVESGSFSRAALQRNCSTVSIMNQINNFERRLVIKLVERSSHGITLTEAGKILYNEAKKLKISSDQILKNTKAIGAGNLPAINIGNSYLRPCRQFLDSLQRNQNIWDKSFQLKIVNFSDDAKEFSELRNKLGDKVDCFISPYDSTDWINNYAIYHLGYYRCCISVPIGHRLASKTDLAWNDLGGETLTLVASGISPIIDQIRYEIELHYPDIKILDSPSYYDIETFNMCQQNGYLMETPEIWKGMHPGLVTIPVDWPYQLPFGLIYSKNPSPAFDRFINMLKINSI